MKKFIASFALVLAAITLAVGTSSCDKIDELLNYLIGGQTYTYEGTYSMQLFQDDPNQENTVIPAGNPVEFKDTKVLLATTGTGDNIFSVKLTVPGKEFMQGVTMADVTLSGLGFANEVLSVTDNSTGLGSLTVNGKEYPLATVDLEAKATYETLIINRLVLYFGENQEYAVLIEYPDGKCVSTTRSAE